MFRILCVLLISASCCREANSDQFRYEPSKLVEESAKLSCRSLARISLGKQENLSISLHTKATIVGTGHKGKKVVAVSYPYRTDGISFACVFYDFTDGQLQLIEFGHVGNNLMATTTVKLLY